MATRKHEGVETRHKRSCRSHEGGRCNCSPSYRVVVWDNDSGRKVTRTFANLAEAKGARHSLKTKVHAGTLRAPTADTVETAAEALVAGMRDGSIRNRKGEPYKPSAIRSYERALRLRILPALGRRKLSDVRRADVQDFVDGLIAAGLDGSTVRNTLDPLRVIFRRALARDLVAVDPMVHLEVPAPKGRRERIASREEAATLLAALPPEERALWATALYGGLRRGELRALRWEDVDLHEGVICVERGWDDSDGEIQGKTRAARRRVPIASPLRRHLVEHRLATGGDPSALVFGSSPSTPFEPTTVRRRALSAWGRASLQPIQLHEARHTFASLTIAAGVNAKALSTYMGHASVTITFDRYGHLMPGNEAEAAALLDAYLA